MGYIWRYDPKAVANYFLHKGKAENRPIDPMGIQKFVYFAHGWNLALHDRPLIDKPVEAWQYGPVIDDLYKAFKQYGNNPITEFATAWEFAPGTMNVQREIPMVNFMDSDSTSLIDRVWDVYKKFSSIQLSNLTHVEGSPWKNARDVGWSVIPDDLIKEYFRKQTNGAR
jgi:uncharacterized phage-associated protein